MAHELDTANADAGVAGQKRAYRTMMSTDLAQMKSNMMTALLPV